MKLLVIDAEKKSNTATEEKIAGFEVKPNGPVVHQMVKAELANARSGTASTKRRDEVRGGGKKPFKQKGTGRARAGSIRSPLWKGGGSVFGPKPRLYTQKMPKKLVALSLRSIIASKSAEGKLFILDKFSTDKPATKAAVELLKALNITGRNTVISLPEESNVARSFRNIEKTFAINVDQISSYALINNDNLIMTKGAFQQFKEKLG